MQFIKDEKLQNTDHQVKACCGANHPAEYKKECACLVGINAKPPFQVRVNGRKVHPVIQRYQHKGNDHVAEEISQNDLVVIKITASHAARYTYERNAAKACTDHTKCNQHPVAVAVANKKRFVIAATGCEISNRKQQNEIPDNKRKQNNGRHINRLGKNNLENRENIVSLPIINYKVLCR